MSSKKFSFYLDLHLFTTQVSFGEIEKQNSPEQKNKGILLFFFLPFNFTKKYL